MHSLQVDDAQARARNHPTMDVNFVHYANHITANQPRIPSCGTTSYSYPTSMNTTYPAQENGGDVFSVPAYTQRNSSFYNRENAFKNFHLKSTQAADAVMAHHHLPDACTGGWTIWSQGYGLRANSSSTDSTFKIGYLGAHYYLDDQTKIGIIGQLDWVDETNSVTNSSASGHGWMIGPYIAGTLSNPDLFYEARAGYGQSENNVSPNGVATGSFGASRWLVSGKLSGNIKKDDYTITPSVSVAYFEETQEAYTNSAATAVPEQTVSLGEVRFGPTLSKAMELDNGMQFTPKLGISGVWNFGVDNNNATQGSVLGDDDLRARVDAGFSATNPDNGMILTLEAFYDGIGASDYDSYGGTARISIPLQ